MNKYIAGVIDSPSFAAITSTHICDGFVVNLPPRKGGLPSRFLDVYLAYVPTSLVPSPKEITRVNGIMGGKTGGGGEEGRGGGGEGRGGGGEGRGGGEKDKGGGGEGRGGGGKGTGRKEGGKGKEESGDGEGNEEVGKENEEEDTDR